MAEPSLEEICARIKGSEVAFRSFLTHIRKATYPEPNAREIEHLHDLLCGWAARDDVPLVRRQFVLLYQSITKWLIDGAFTYPGEGGLQARTQYWELEWNCPHFQYQKLFTTATFEKFPALGGFKAIHTIYSTVQGTNSSFVDSRADPDIRIYRRPGAKTTIVGFAAKDQQLAGVGWTLFDRAVAEPLNANLVVFKDHNHRMYLAGIKSIGNFDESKIRLSEILDEFRTTKIIGIGASSGVFGALNFGSDIGINHIIALSGPTSLDIGLNSGTRPLYKTIAEDHKAGLLGYPDLVKRVLRSPIERIDFFVGGRNEYDIAQMRNLSDSCNHVTPHIYERNGAHVVADLCISDGTLFDAINIGG